jgi:hypothetical protein
MVDDKVLGNHTQTHESGDGGNHRWWLARGEQEVQSIRLRPPLPPSPSHPLH